MYGLAIGLEIALAFSTRYKGSFTPLLSVNEFTHSLAGYPLAPEAGYSFGNVQFLKVGSPLHTS